MRVLNIIYQETYDAVTEEIELSKDWLKNNTEVSTDARALLIHFLDKAGVPQLEIANFMNLSRSCVCKHISEYDLRRASHKMLKIWEAQISLNLTSRLQRLSHELPSSATQG